MFMTRTHLVAVCPCLPILWGWRRPRRVVEAFPRLSHHSAELPPRLCTACNVSASTTGRRTEAEEQILVTNALTEAASKSKPVVQSTCSSPSKQKPLIVFCSWWWPWPQSQCSWSIVSFHFCFAYMLPQMFFLLIDLIFSVLLNSNSWLTCTTVPSMAKSFHGWWDRVIVFLDLSDNFIYLIPWYPLNSTHADNMCCN